MNQMVMDRLVSKPVQPARPAAFRTNPSGLPLLWDGEVPARRTPDGSRGLHLALKRLFDIVGAGFGLLLLLPLLLVVAVAIKLTSRGPVFFRQTREGKDGETFRIYKFRSMRTDRGDPTGVAQTVAGDPRVTAIGRFIRRTSIDELPQLINVLRGEMSLVGPRPHVPGMLGGGMRYDRLVPYYAMRLQAKPGLTGWAQANGLRGPTDNAELARARIDHDIAYIENFSFWLDLKIIALTIRHEFLGGSGH